VDLKAEQKQFRTHVVFETLTMNVLFKHHSCSCLENCIEKKKCGTSSSLFSTSAASIGTTAASISTDTASIGTEV
jgi:hypothetical protein